MGSSRFAHGLYFAYRSGVEMTNVETERKRTSLFAVSSLVLGIIASVAVTSTQLIIAVYIVVVLLAHVGYGEIRRGVRTGRWIAAIGLALGYFALAVMTLALIIGD